MSTNYKDNALKRLDADLMDAAELVLELRGFFHPDVRSPKITRIEAKKIWYRLHCLIGDTIISEHMGFINLLKEYEDDPDV